MLLWRTLTSCFSRPRRAPRWTAVSRAQEACRQPSEGWRVGARKLQVATRDGKRLPSIDVMPQIHTISCPLRVVGSTLRSRMKLNKFHRQMPDAITKVVFELSCPPVCTQIPRTAPSLETPSRRKSSSKAFLIAPCVYHGIIHRVPDSIAR